MISISYRTGDPFSEYGIDHFVKKTGIPFDRVSDDTRTIVMSYGTGVTEDFQIQIHQNEIDNGLKGIVSTHERNAYVCQTARDTGERNSVIARFDAGNVQYPCVTRTDNGIEIGLDIFKETGYVLSGHLDRIWGTLSEEEKTGIATRPTVDFLEDLLLFSVREGCKTLHIPLVQKSYWPEGKKMALCLSHDVDEVKKTYQWLTRPLRCIVRRDFRGLRGQILALFQKLHGADPYWTFGEIIDIEQRFQASSTFFFLKETGKPEIFKPKTWNLYGRNHSFEDPDVIRAMRLVSDNGDEVAIHGSFYSYDLPGLIEKETRELESIIERKVNGIRQHHLNLSVPATWDLQIKAGLLYDTSLGYKDRIGFRWGTSYPFLPFNGMNAIPLHEIPLIIMDICLLSRVDPVSESLAVVNEVERYNGVLTLLWHPPVFNVCEFPYAGEVYSRLIERSLESGAWIATSEKIAEWQESRNRMKLSCGQQGSSFVVTSTAHGKYGYYTIEVEVGYEYKISSGAAEVIMRERMERDPNSEFIHLRITGDGDQKIVVTTE